MLSEKLIKRARGYFTVSIYDSFAESALNECANAKIDIWNVRRNGKALIFCSSAGNLKRLEAVLTKAHIAYEIISKTGLNYLIKKYRNRYALALGAVLASAFVFFMSSFIWSIKIEGNVNLTDEEILEVLDEVGFSEGIIKKKINYYALYQRVILKKPEIAWMAINIKGTRAEVQILERELPPVIDDSTEPSNIIATESGIIEEMQVFAGTPLVKVGQAVEKGDVLVSSAVTNLDGSVKYVSAKAEIIARTGYTLRYTCPDKISTFTQTGRTVQKYRLKILSFTLNLAFNSRIPYARYDKIIKDNQLCLGEDYYLPIHLICDTYSELSVTETKLDESAQLEMASRALNESLEEMLPYAQITDTKLTHYMDGDSLVAELEVQCTENIALKIPITEDAK